MENTKNLLESYIPLAKSTAKMFGPNCEVVIHDLTNPQASVMFTVNHHVTGRKKIGQSFDHLVKTVFYNPEILKKIILLGIHLKQKTTVPFVLRLH
ncbi:hypothetical protein BsIDN1_34010 [Bacillus safensis]|uniref:YheO-like domain-containing protein n=1 Tax=Bacillus safensis TaxID=561879 RepID=A0A5S9M9H2_BACIA|nr:hypothetical protein BsIDN1_34010 [Bacillus safensis]